MSWIKCSEMMPPDDLCIVWCEQYGGKWDVWFAFYSPVIKEFTGLGDDDILNVTHWQPLPSPPEGE